MSEHKIMSACFLCGDQFQMGPHAYDGKQLRSYDIAVCNSCYDGNRDGWAIQYEQRLLEHLKNKGLPIPKRNAKNLLPLKERG